MHDADRTVKGNVNNSYYMAVVDRVSIACLELIKLPL